MRVLRVVAVAVLAFLLIPLGLYGGFLLGEELVRFRESLRETLTTTVFRTVTSTYSTTITSVGTVTLETTATTTQAITILKTLTSTYTTTVQPPQGRVEFVTVAKKWFNAAVLVRIPDPHYPNPWKSWPCTWEKTIPALHIELFFAVRGDEAVVLNRTEVWVEGPGIAGRLPYKDRYGMQETPCLEFAEPEKYEEQLFFPGGFLTTVEYVSFLTGNILSPHVAYAPEAVGGKGFNILSALLLLDPGRYDDTNPYSTYPVYDGRKLTEAFQRELLEAEEGLTDLDEFYITLTYYLLSDIEKGIYKPYNVTFQLNMMIAPDGPCDPPIIKCVIKSR